MKRSLALFLFLFLIFFSLFAWGETRVILSNSEVIVNNKDVYLRDVAKIEGDLKDTLSMVRIISSPLPGETRKIEKKYVLIRLRQLDLGDEKVIVLGPEVITIKRAYQEISEDLIRSAIEEKIANIIPSWVKRYEVFLGIPKFSPIAPLGDVGLFIDLPSPEKIRGKKIFFPVTITINGKKWKRFYVTAKLSLYADFPVAVVSIKKGGKILKDSYKIEERKVEEISFPYVFPSNVEGYVALKNIYPGTIINRTYVTRPYQVRRGEIVNVVLKRGVITIMLKAQALSNGSYGDIIELKNLKSGKKFTGIVKDYGLVIVK